MKKRITAVVLMFALFASSALAVNAYKKSIEVEYGITLSINGQTPTLTDVNGKTVQPFVYEGTTYVPIRAVGENLGATVDYDGNANRATLVSSGSSSGITAQDLHIISCIEDMEDVANMYLNIKDNFDFILESVLSGDDYTSLIPSLNSAATTTKNRIETLSQEFSALSPYMVSGMYDDISGNMVLLNDCAETTQTCQNIVSHLMNNPYDYDAMQDLLDCYGLLAEIAMSVGTSAENAFNQWITILLDKT